MYFLSAICCPTANFRPLLRGQTTSLLPDVNYCELVISIRRSLWTSWRGWVPKPDRVASKIWIGKLSDSNCNPLIQEPTLPLVCRFKRSVIAHIPELKSTRTALCIKIKKELRTTALPIKDHYHLVFEVL